MFKKFFITSLLLFGASLQGLYGGGIDWFSAHQKVYELPEEDFSRLAASENVHDLYKAALDMLTRMNNEEAREIFLRVDELTGGSYEADWGLAELNRRERLYEKSADALDEIMENQPEFVPAYISRAYIYFEQREYSGAIELASKVIDKEDRADTANFIRAHLIVGGARGLVARESYIITKITRGLSARRYLSRARDIDPDFPPVIFAWGIYYLEAPSIAGGDMDKAEEHLRRALEEMPDFVDVHARLAQFYFEKGDMEKYHRYLESARSLDPDSPLVDEAGRLGENND